MFLAIFLISFGASAVITALPFMVRFILERDRVALCAMGAWTLFGVVCGFVGVSLL